MLEGNATIGETAWPSMCYITTWEEDIQYIHEKKKYIQYDSGMLQLCDEVKEFAVNQYARESWYGERPLVPLCSAVLWRLSHPTYESCTS